MNEMDPEPALSSRPSSEAKVENEKAVPITKNTRQKTAATTTGPDVVDTTPPRRQAVPQICRGGFCIQASTEVFPWPGLASVSVSFVLIDASSKSDAPRGGLSPGSLSTLTGSVVVLRSPVRVGLLSQVCPAGRP